jgi:hypothetical protein
MNKMHKEWENTESATFTDEEEKVELPKVIKETKLNANLTKYIADESIESEKESF